MDWRLVLAIDTRVLDFRLFFEKLMPIVVDVGQESYLSVASESYSRKLPDSSFQNFQAIHRAWDFIVEERELQKDARRRGGDRRRRRDDLKHFPSEVPEGKGSGRPSYIIHENTWPSVYRGNITSRPIKLFCLYRECGCSERGEFQPYIRAHVDRIHRYIRSIIRTVVFRIRAAPDDRSYYLYLDRQTRHFSIRLEIRWRANYAT